MTEIIARLRACADGMGSFKSSKGDFGLCDDAADEIERLRANIDRLTGNPVDHRYWEGRYRNEKSENEQLVKALASIEDEIFANGAPLGSEAYFKIRELALLRNGGAE